MRYQRNEKNKKIICYSNCVHTIFKLGLGDVTVYAVQEMCQPVDIWLYHFYRARYSHVISLFPCDLG